MPLPVPHSLRTGETLVPRAEWLGLEDAHRERVESLTEGWLQRRGRGEKHPVEDFLFTYYRLPPTRLQQWMPGAWETLELEPGDLEDRLHWQSPPFSLVEDRLSFDLSQLRAKQRALALWIAELCERMLERPPRFNCFGLHEWAMVYRQSAEQVRHQGYALRLPPEDLARFVEAQSLCCTHYDAYRFFTPEAVPRNSHHPTLETRPEFEQAGCLHANMDLYKWSAKLLPWIGSDLVGRCFELALEGRRLDMRASPYDLLDLGYPPLRIETLEGRRDYETQQRMLTERAQPLRRELAQAARRLAED